MRQELEFYEQIDRYLAQLMSAEERTAFELQMSTDASLREAVQLAGLTNELIVEHTVHGKKAFLQQLEANYNTPPSSTTHWKIIIGLTVAAAAAAMVYFLIPRSTEKNITTNTTSETVLETSKEVVTESNTEEVFQEKTTPRNKNVVEQNTEKANTETVVINPNPKEEVTETIEPVTQPVPSEKTEVKKETKISCADQFKNIVLESSPSCKKESNGAIHVKVADKSTSMFLDEEKISNNESGLNAGTYVVVFKSNDGCMISKSVRVESVSCIQNKQLNWSFSDPGNWSIELNQNEAKLMIMDRAGKILKDETIRGNEYAVPSEIFPAAGIYQFRILYPDGETEQGYIQIVP